MTTTKKLLCLVAGTLCTTFALNTYGQTPISDDFDETNLNTALWTVEDPGGTSTTNFSIIQTVGYGSTNVELQIAVPGGDSHDAGTFNNAVRVMQPVDGTTNFEVTAKFDTVPTNATSYEGIMFEDGMGNATRIDAAYNNGTQYLYQENVTGVGNGFVAAYSGYSVQMTDIPTNSINTIYLRVAFTAGPNTCATYTSTNGVNWIQRTASVPVNFAPVSVGVHAGNFDSSGTNAPAFTCKVDYFFNDASPIIYEDGQTNANPPSVTLVSPAAYNPLFDTGSNLTASVTATSVGAIANVALFAGTNLVASTNAPTSGSSYSLTWTNLPAGDYVLNAVATDNQGLSSTSSVVKVYIRTPGSLTSDDFNNPINTNMWAFIDPLGNDSATIVGAGTGESELRIGVAAGAAHDSFHQTLAPRLMQVITNQDFNVVVKFNSIPTINSQIEGILVEDNTGKGVRIDGADMRNVLLVNGVHVLEQWTGANINYGNASQVADIAITSPPIPPSSLFGGQIYEMVNKSGDSWTISVSPDGVNWQQTVNFVYHLVVNDIGVYGDTAGGNPAWTARVDYFNNLDAPLTNEDGSTNGPPVVNLLSPTPGEGFSVGSSIPLSLDAMETSGGAVTNVQFYAWTNAGPLLLVGTSTNTSTPFTAQWINTRLALGNSPYIYAKATAYGGAVTYSPIVNVLITSSTNGGIFSDDFNNTSVNTNVWQELNTTDGTFATTNAYSGHADLLITANASATHSAWTANTAPYIMETVVNEAFTIDAKFDTVPATVGQDEGFLVMNSSGQFLRFDVLVQIAGQTNLTSFAAYVSGTAANDYVVDALIYPWTSILMPTNGNAGTLYMKLSYDGSQYWDFYTSPDNMNWTEVAYFPQTLAVSKVGLFAGNNAGTPYTAAVDYFEDSNAPLTNQDGIVYPVPDLHIAVVSGQVQISWTDTPGVTLQGTSSLSPANWSGVTNAPVLSGGQDTVTVPNGGSAQYYRLIQ